MRLWDYDETCGQSIAHTGDYWGNILKTLDLSMPFDYPIGLTVGYNSVAGPSFKSYREGDSHYLSSNVPGLKKDELSVAVKDRVLTIKAETKKESKSVTKYSFTKQYTLPDNIEVGDTNPEAKLEDGVLQVRFKGFYKKIEPPEKKEFEIHIE